MRNEANQNLYNAQRELYLDHKLTHAEFYTWLAEFIGANDSMLPVTKARIMASRDQYLNDIPLKLWDNQDYLVRRLAYNKGLVWSLSDTVCTLKQIAHNLIG